MSESKGVFRGGFVEFLAIFLGVSLSFIAEDWREALGERTEATRVLAGPVSDLEDDMESIRVKVFVDSAGLESAQWLHMHWDRDDLPTDSLEAALGGLDVGATYSPIRSEYESRGARDASN